MLSKKNYHGRLSYDEYVNRFSERSKVFKDHLQDAIDKKKSSIKDSVTKRFNDKKNELTEKGKTAISKVIEDHTGINPENIKKVFNDNMGESKSVNEEKRREDIIQGIILAKSHKPNTDFLTQDEIDHAKLTRASKIHYLNDDGGLTTQDYLDKHNLGTLLPESDTSGIVVRRPDGKIEIAYRGTALTEQPNSQDFITDAKVMAGMEEGIGGGIMKKTKQYADADAQFSSVVEKYGAVDHISGYSRGGAIGLYLGNKNNVETTTLNPLVGPRLATLSQNTSAEHTIIRTTEDPVSMGLAATSSINHDKWTVKAIKPLEKYQSLIPVKNIYDAHRLDNFTENSPRKVLPDQDEIHANRIKIASQKLHQVTALDDITSSIKSGQSFTEYMKKNNPGDVVNTPDGPRLSGNRLSPDSFLTKNWKKYGGEFTEGEAKWVADTWDHQEGKIKLDLENRGHHTEVGDKKITVVEPPNNDMVAVLPQEDTSPPKEIETIKPIKPIEPIEPDYNGKENARLDNAFNEWGNKKFVSSQDAFTPIEQDNYVLSNPENKSKLTNELHNELQDALSTHVEVNAPMEEAGLSDNMRGINPTALGIGYAVGQGVNSALDLIPGYSNLNPIEKETASGSLTAIATVGASAGLGVLTSVAEGGLAALGPEIAAGAAGMVAGTESAKLFASGVKSVGGNEFEQDAAADIGGGSVGGFAAGAAAAGTALAADALLGTELGAVFGPGGMVAGAVLGAGLGALALGAGELAKPLSSAWNSFKSIF